MKQLILLALVIAVAVVVLLRVLPLLRRGHTSVLDRDGRSAGSGGGADAIRWLARLAVPVAIVLVLLTSVHVVPVGHALVIFNTVTRSFRTASQGVQFVPPFIADTALYDLRRVEYTMTQTKGEGRKPEWDDSLWSPTREGLQVGIDLTVWHHIDPLKVAEIHQRIGPDYEEKIIRPAVRSVIRLVISEYAVADVYSEKRSAIQDEINLKVKKLVEPDGFIVDELVLRDVRFTPQFAQAIEAKQIAQQSAEQMKYVLEKEQREAERKVIEAEGRSKAIQTINTALRENPNYIKYLYVDKLSDKVQVIVSDQSTIMDLKGLLQK